MPIQVFLSYARADDELPPNRPDGKGFVTCLLEQLDYELVQLGAQQDIRIWRDLRKIAPGDQFDPIIEDAINESHLFVAVLSPNWMASDFCKEELKRFSRRWASEGELRVRQRIIVACKRFVDRDKRPSLLQGQQGYNFFVFEGPKETGLQLDFFSRGEIRDDRYERVVQQLADYLYGRGQHIARPSIVPPPAPPTAEAPDRPSANPDARKIYLAKPASDMREAYARLVKELARNGYAIVPDPDKAIPYDASATSFIDAALAEADVSIHLLGEGDGYTPENSQPIVRLQLARAATRVAAAATKQDQRPRAGFRRIIWAPETIEDLAPAASADSSAPPGAAPNRAAPAGTPATPADEGRRPDQVLSRFGAFEPSDKVLGGNLSKFVDFLIEHLRQSDTPSRAAAEPTEDDWVYVYHVPEDTAYACDLMDALKQRGIAANLPALEGDAVEVRRIHQQYLAECSAVVLCWAQATEAWAHAHAFELKDWKKLGRQKRFNYRGLLALPPPGVRKSVFAKYPPANEIDVVVNLAEDTRPIVEAIDKFAKPAPPPAP